MGTFKKNCQSGTGSSINNPAPNPKNFQILKYEKINNFLIVEIKYPDATNFEGIKLLVFKDFNISELFLLKEIDPHFSDSLDAPVSRFKPTKSGWALARAMCQLISNPRALE